jgi:hypothetical protein
VAGWKEFEICPVPVIKECSIGIPSVSGYISSSFKDSDESFILNVTVPEGTLAHITLPEQSYKSVKMNGKDAEMKMTVKSGKYEIICTK